MRKTFRHLRFSHGDDSTLGAVRVPDQDSETDAYCYTCEDEHREVKVSGETRIPAGDYRILLRDAGGMNSKYADRYPFHKGMLWLQDVPNFEWIYIHTGNNDDHSEGCILVGNSFKEHSDGGGTIGGSRDAYARIYNLIVSMIDQGHEVYWSISEF